ncbi:MAG: type II toxin-antitoxin system RelB/DinJ family antitoxin [Spirochaetaceae bacterium]|jgi:DNA-damage-inducible protein J|nr:type II toxin-antitoxin system RelB/DinJ family antitoxin [Spirochaetaceae bacterium]
MATTVQIRVDDVTKREADSLFGELGLDISTAFRMFLSACLRLRGLPFTVSEKPAQIEVHPIPDPYAGKLPGKLTKEQQEILHRIVEKGPAGFSHEEKMAAFKRLDGCLKGSTLTLEEVREERIRQHAGY